MQHTLYNDDCLTVLATLPNACVDMVFCDLPYGTTNNPWDSVVPLDELWKQLNRVCKENAAVVLTAQTPFDKILGASNLANLRYEWIWHKNKATGHLNAKKMPMKAHENVLVFYRRLPTFNPQKTTGHASRNAGPVNLKEYADRNYQCTTQVRNTGGQTDRYPRSVLEIPVINNDSSDKWHPTQKPVELAQYFIRTYSNPGDTVLDMTMGSGSTGVACKAEGRGFIGIELDIEYFNRASTWIAESNYQPYIYQPQSEYGYLKEKHK